MPSVAGPRRPQDRVELRGVKQCFRSALVDVFKKEVGESATPRLDRWSAEAPVVDRVSESVARQAAATQDEHEAATTEHLKDDRRRRGHRRLDDQWVQAHPRRRGDRRHHQLHQHQQPVGDDRRRPAGQEGRRARADG